jgi:hypothetical protein
MRFSRPAPKELQRRRHLHLRIVEFRDRRRRHHIAAIDHDRIVIGRRHLAEAGDVLVELDLHQPVFGPGVHLARLGLVRLQLPQRLGLRHLVDHDLAGLQRRLGDAVAGLDDRRLVGRLGGARIGGALEEAADRDGVGGVVGALVDDLQRIVGADDRGGDLDAAGAPAAGKRHLARAERHLVAGTATALSKARRIIRLVCSSR